MGSNVNAGVFPAEPLWKFQHQGPAGPRSSSGGHQQRSCWDQRQVLNSPGKLPDRLTKGRVCFLWEERRRRGWEKGYPWVEQRRWAAGLINLLKNQINARRFCWSQGAAAPPPAEEGEKSQNLWLTSKQDQWTEKEKTKLSVFCSQLQSNRGLIPGSTPLEPGVFTPLLHLSGVLNGESMLYPSSWKGNGQFNIWWQEFNLLHW